MSSPHAKASIQLSADLREYYDALKKLPGMTDKEARKGAQAMEKRFSQAQARLAEKAERVQKEAVKAASAMGRFQGQAELFERMRSALGPLGDSLGDLTGGLDDVGSAFDSFSIAQVAGAAAALIAVAAVVKLGGAVLDVITNLEDYRDLIDDMSGRGVISPEQIANLEDANAALQVLDAEMQAVAITIAADLAPAVSVLARGITPLIAASVNLAQAAALFTVGMYWQAVRNLKDAFLDASDATEDYDDRVQDVIDKLEKLRRDKAAKDATRDAAAAAREAAKATKEWAERIEKDLGPKLRKWLGPVGEWIKATAELDKLTLKAFTAALDPMDKINEKYDALILRALDAGIATKNWGQAAAVAAELEKQRRTELDALSEKLAGNEGKRRAKIRKQAAADAERLEKEQAMVRESMFASASAITGFVSQSLDAVAMQFDTSTAEGKKAARSMAIAQRTLAVFSIGLNLVAAIAQSLGQAGPVAGAALAVAVVGAFAGLIATAAKPIPQFHTGRFGSPGLLGDEGMSGGAVTLAPEVVIPPDLVSRVGGPDQVRGRLEQERPMIVQAVIDLSDERIVLPLSRALGARERGRIGFPLGRSTT